MNYRHAYHAGNFADVLKHAVLVALLQRLRAGRAAGATSIIDVGAARLARAPVGCSADVADRRGVRRRFARPP